MFLLESSVKNSRLDPQIYFYLQQAKWVTEFKKIINVDDSALQNSIGDKAYAGLCPSIFYVIPKNKTHCMLTFRYIQPHFTCLAPVYT